MQMTQNSGCRGKFSAPPTSRLHVLFKHPLPALVTFELIRLKPRSSELTSLSQALCVTEVFLHMVFVEAELLPGTHLRSRDVLWGLPPP